MTKRIAALAAIAATASLGLPAASANGSCSPTMPVHCVLEDVIRPVCVPLPQGAELCLP